MGVRPGSKSCIEKTSKSAPEKFGISLAHRVRVSENRSVAPEPSCGNWTFATSEKGLMGPFLPSLKFVFLDDHLMFFVGRTPDAVSNDAMSAGAAGRPNPFPAIRPTRPDDRNRTDCPILNVFVLMSYPVAWSPRSEFSVFCLTAPRWSPEPSKCVDEPEGARPTVGCPAGPSPSAAKMRSYGSGKCDWTV